MIKRHILALAILALGAGLAACGGGGSDSSSANTGGNNPPPGGGNTPPTLSGSPPTQAMEGQPFSFTPTASDADGDTLTFTAQNLPSWANLNPSTGQVTGTPGPGDVAVYSNISFTVSDGQASLTIGPFQITVVSTALGSVTLNWQDPTQRTDGTPLNNDLKSINIHWGTSPGNYPNVHSVGAGVMTYMVSNLTPNTYYFVATAVDNSGLESAISNMATKTVP